jgi:hypothetical protein
LQDIITILKENKNDPNSPQGLRYAEFISPLIKAIQEQQVIINNLKQEISSLKQRLDTAGIP